MNDPVITADGFTYDKLAIEKWLKDHDTSPKTGQKLFSKTLIPNHLVRSQIQDYRKKKSLPPAKPWVAPSANENASPPARAGGNPSITIAINRSPTNGQQQAMPTDGIGRVIAPEVFHRLQGIIAYILEQKPWLLQDFNLFGPNHVALQMDAAASVILSSPEILRAALPHFMDHPDARQILEPAAAELWGTPTRRIDNAPVAIVQ